MSEQSSLEPAEGGAEARRTSHPPPLELEPIERDGRFIYRLIAGFVLAVVVVLLVGGWIKGAAAHCGSGLIRPGVTVIPAR